MPTVGCLILHGFTSSADSVNRLAVRLLQHNIPYRMPTLRGHHTQPEDLHGVTWHDWYADADAAFTDLRREVDQVLVVGLSMGGLLALHVAAARPREVAGVVSLAAAMRFHYKHAHRVRYLATIKPMLGNENRDMGIGWHEPELGRKHGNYRRFPPKAFVSLWRYARIVEQQLPRIYAPLLLIHSRADRTIPGAASELIYHAVGSQDKELVWFERSGHEMLRDTEAAQVLDRIEAFILARVAHETLTVSKE